MFLSHVPDFQTLFFFLGMSCPLLWNSQRSSHQPRRLQILRRFLNWDQVCLFVWFFSNIHYIYVLCCVYFKNNHGKKKSVQCMFQHPDQVIYSVQMYIVLPSNSHNALQNYIFRHIYNILQMFFKFWNFQFFKFFINN